MNTHAIIGCILGTAMGDALGLPYEGLTSSRAGRLFKNRDKYHFLFSRGMVSDDTEHTCMVAQALIRSGSDKDLFARALARGLRYWFLGMPAGIGFATLRSCLKLWLGFPASKSGVYSAGNGPAMRTALIGVCYGSDEQNLIDLVQAATRITHTDPKAFHGALAVALAAHLSATKTSVDQEEYVGHLERLLSKEQAGPFLALMEDVVKSVGSGRTTQEFIESLNMMKGVSGYVFHTVPAVIHSWMSFPNDFKKALLDIIGCGGDTDTTGAILGAIVGAGVGKQGIPKAWLKGLMEWPRTVAWMETLARQLSESLDSKKTSVPPRLPLTGIAFRNLLFTMIILIHGFRRLLPPY